MKKAAHVETGVSLLKDGRQHRIDFVACKRRDPDLVSEPFAGELCEPAAQLCTHFILAVGDQQKKRLRDRASSERAKKVQSGAVAPMRSFDDDKECGGC